eukprot:COSAG01_NODE_52534_length_346_cov_0.627530_1_plen_63_part_10
MKFGELVGTVHDNCQPLADPLPEDDGQHEAAAALSGGAEALLTAHCLRLYRRQQGLSGGRGGG